MWSLGGKEDCCTKLVPDTAQSQKLLRSVNSAFTSSQHVLGLAEEVQSQFRSITGQPLRIAMHWRGSEDFVNTSHSLNVGQYRKEVISAIRTAREELLAIREVRSTDDLQLFILGDLKEDALRTLQSTLNEELSSSLFTLRLHSKDSIMPNVDFDDLFEGADDLKGQVDFEIGLQSRVFISSPFSSFSWLIAFTRASQRASLHLRKTIPANVDTVDRLAEIFSILFPLLEEEELKMAASPCTRLIDAHPKYGNSLQRCADREIASDRRLDRVKRKSGKRKTFVLHRFKSCQACPRIPLCSMDKSMMNIRLRMALLQDWKLESQIFSQRVKSPVAEWGCDKAEISVRENGAFRDKRTGSIYAIEYKNVTVPPIREGMKATMQDERDYCYHLSPKFSFSPPLDDPLRHGSRCDAVIITAVFGTVDSLAEYKEDNLRSFEVEHSVTSCWFAFMDSAAIARLPKISQRSDCQLYRHNIWTVIHITEDMLPHPPHKHGLNSRVPKMLAHRLFRTASYLLYHDAQLRLKDAVNAWSLIIANIIDTRAAWSSPRNPIRTSFFEEARCIHKLGLAPDVIFDQMEFYWEAALARHANNDPTVALIEGEWHVRDLHHPASSQISCRWYEEFTRWTHERDQLSFNYALWSVIDSSTTMPSLFHYGTSENIFNHLERPHSNRTKSTICEVKGTTMDRWRIALSYIATKGNPDRFKLDGSRAGIPILKR